MSLVLAGEKTDGLFFAGDFSNGFFGNRFLEKLGVTRGRSNTLKINYRTSHQIRQQADRLLPKEISDLDENEESRKAKISAFNSLPPQILVVDDPEKKSVINTD